MKQVNTKVLKGHLPLYIALLILVLGGMWALKRCSHPADSLISANFTHPGGDTLAVAIEMSPLTYAYSGDSVVGFDYELLRDICRLHKQPVVFQPFAPLEYAFNGLEEGTFDIVVANVPATADLRETFGTTEPIFTDRAVLVQRSDSDSTRFISNTRQLAGKELWIADGSSLRTRLKNLADEMGDSIDVRSNPDYSAEHLGIMVSKGEIPLAVINESVAQSLAADYPNLDISVPVSFSQFQTWIVDKGNTKLLERLNQWIKEYKATAAYRNLVKKYFN